ncbi:unnamed protein product [Calypogeia fissa]
MQGKGDPAVEAWVHQKQSQSSSQSQEDQAIAGDTRWGRDESEGARAGARRKCKNRQGSTIANQQTANQGRQRRSLRVIRGRNKPRIEQSECRGSEGSSSLHGEQREQLELREKRAQGEQ